MKNNSISFCCALSFLLIIGCYNGDSKIKTETAAKTPTEKPAAANVSDNKKGTISFKINGELIQTSAWNVSTMNAMNGVCMINVTSNMHEDTRNININVNACAPGAYAFSHGGGTVSKKGAAYGSYRPDYLKHMSELYSIESGEFIILPNNGNGKMLNATFSGKAKNKDGEEVEITEGKVVDAPIKESMPRGAVN